MPVPTSEPALKLSLLLKETFFKKKCKAVAELIVEEIWSNNNNRSRRYLNFQLSRSSLRIYPEHPVQLCIPAGIGLLIYIPLFVCNLCLHDAEDFNFNSQSGRRLKDLAY